MAALKRPSRSELEATIRKHLGVLTRVADELGVTRPTLYKWIYQLDLSVVAGIGRTPVNAAGSAQRLSRVVVVDGVDGTPGVDSVDGGKHIKRYVNAPVEPGPILVGVSQTAPAFEIPEQPGPKASTSMRLDDELWKWTRKFGVDHGLSGGEVVELALRNLRQQVERGSK